MLYQYQPISLASFDYISDYLLPDNQWIAVGMKQTHYYHDTLHVCLYNSFPLSSNHNNHELISITLIKVFI